MDRDLVDQARRGDREAYAVLAHQVSDSLYAVAFRILRDAGLAEDALQNALVLAWRRLPKLRDVDRFEVEGTQIVVMTPPMHPLVWLKDDFLWLGGGKTGVDPATERRFVVVERDDHTLLVQFANDPATFDARDAEVRALLDSISFP